MKWTGADEWISADEKKQKERGRTGMGHGTLERNADECGREGELAESAGMDGIRQCLESVFILQTESPSAHPQ